METTRIGAPRPGQSAPVLSWAQAASPQKASTTPGSSGSRKRRVWRIVPSQRRGSSCEVVSGAGRLTGGGDGRPGSNWTRTGPAVGAATVSSPNGAVTAGVSSRAPAPRASSSVVTFGTWSSPIAYCQSSDRPCRRAV